MAPRIHPLLFMDRDLVLVLSPSSGTVQEIEEKGTSAQYWFCLLVVLNSPIKPVRGLFLTYSFHNTSKLCVCCLVLVSHLKGQINLPFYFTLLFLFSWSVSTISLTHCCHVLLYLFSPCSACFSKGRTCQLEMVLVCICFNITLIFPVSICW